jgi:2-keto-4-pentenoate hydratase
METMRPALDRLATDLANAWRTARPIPLPSVDDAPATRAEAFAVQDRLAELLGEPVAGWKVGAAVRAVQRLEGHDGPIPGRVFAPRVYESPARVPADRYDGYKIECEFAFRFLRDVPARDGGHVRAALEDAIVFLPGPEVAGTRFALGGASRKLTTRDSIADNGTGGAYVTGRAIDDWRGIDFEHMPIDARIEGGERVETYFGELRRDAVDVLVETVNGLCERGIGVRAGEVMFTGSLTMPTPLSRGQTFVARFGQLQQLSVTME